MANTRRAQVLLTLASARGWRSLTAFAAGARVHRQTLRTLVRGDREPRRRTLQRMADALGMPLRELADALACEVPRDG